MAPLAELVFLTPWAALVGLAFIAPLVMLAIRERASARVSRTSTCGLCALSRVLPRPLALVASGRCSSPSPPRSRQSVPPIRRPCAPTPSSSSRSTSAARCWRRALRAASCGWSARARSGRNVHAALPDVPDGRRDAHEPDDAAPLPDRRRARRDGRDRSLAATHAASACALSRRHARARSGLSPSQRTAATSTRVRGSARWSSSAISTATSSASRERSGCCDSNRIEPFLVRVAAPGEQIFDASGRPNAYVSVSTVSVEGLRRARWHAFEEGESRRLVSEIRTYLGQGPVEASGLVESQRTLAPCLALAALALSAVLVLPALRAGFPARA